MAKAVADVNNPNERQGGFASDERDITGFSQMHDSGTGGVWNSFHEQPLLTSTTVTILG